MTDAERVEEVYRYWTVLYELCPTGGPAHVVTDDGNVGDDSIRWCLANLRDHWQEELGCYTAQALLIMMLLHLTEDQRATIYDGYWRR